MSLFIVKELSQKLFLAIIWSKFGEQQPILWETTLGAITAVSFIYNSLLSRNLYVHLQQNPKTNSSGVASKLFYESLLDI